MPNISKHDESKQLSIPRRSTLESSVSWAHRVAGLFVLLTLTPSGYVIYFLWMMFRETTGDRSIEGYLSIPGYLYTIAVCFATSIAFTVSTAGVEYLWGSETEPTFEYTKLAAILSPWPLLIGFLGFWFVLASTGARWGS